MGWRDRDYYRGREAAYGFFARPSSALGWSVPFGTFRSFYIRLHFWFLLWALFWVVGIIRSQVPLYYIPAGLGTLLVILLIHEFGHRILAQRVGGNHWEFVLWPLGGMSPPQAPPTPWATFVANIGGILFTIPIAVAVGFALLRLPHVATSWHLVPTPFQPLAVLTFYGGAGGALPQLGVFVLARALEFSAAIVVINFFPCYWFDGGRIWESILWPSLGRYRATTITCMAGMVLAVPFFLLSLWGTDFLGLIVWALIFSDCFNRRREMITAGPGALEEESYAYSAMDTGDDDRPRRRRGGWWQRNAAKKARQERVEQQKIDAILEKVHLHGLHSLTWLEKRTLKKATERQRQREVAERLRERV